ncbi:MAG TPA: hypothetical protein VIW68_08400 [Candidatus Sulfotelmatobacter sp.]
MPDQTTEQELRDRLSLIESMIAEGRRTTQKWGWTFVLWGVAYLIAMAWAIWGHSTWAWPITMTAAVIVTVAGAMATINASPHPATTMGRAIGSIWIALGITMFLLFAALGFSGRLADQRLFIAAVSAILGMANGASALILRWKIQFVCALVWWATAVASCFSNDSRSTIEFLIAIFLCQIIFGIYGMIAESRARKRQGGNQHGHGSNRQGSNQQGAVHA